MAIRSKGVNARDKAFTNAYNNAKQRNDLDFYNKGLDYSSKYGYQDLFVQRYNSMTEEQRDKIRTMLYNVEDDYKAQVAFQEMTIDLLDNTEKKKFNIIKYDEEGNPVLNEAGDNYLEEEVEMTEYEHARMMLDRVYDNSIKKMGYDYTLKQQQSYKDNLEWYHKAVADVTGVLQEFHYGIDEALLGVVDFLGSIGYAIGKGIGTGFKEDGYREYYEKYALSKGLQEGFGADLAEYERLYTDYRDVFTGDYTGVGKYLCGISKTIGNMFPFMLIPGGGALGMTGKGAKVFNESKNLLYYAGMFASSQSATINDPNFANVSTLSIVFNGVIKTAAEVTIEKLLSKALGATFLDKRRGLDTSKGFTKFVDKIAKKSAGKADAFTNFLTRNTKVFGKFLKEALQEGLEEGLQEISGMCIDAMFDSKGETFFKEGWNWQNVIDAVLIGAMVSGSMSTVNFMTTKRIGTGNMEEKFNKKTGKMEYVEKKLSKAQSIIYNSQIENLYNAYERLIKNAQKSGDVDTGAFWAAQAYESYAILMEYFKGIGIERSKNALELLKSIQSSPEKAKSLMSASYVQHLIKSMKDASATNKIITSSPEFIEKMKGAKVTTATNLSQDSVENMSPEWRKILQEKWKENPDFKLMSTNGTDIVVGDGIIMVPEAWFKQGALEVFKTVAEREVVNTLYTELLENEKALLDTIVKEYMEWSGETDISPDKALYALLYDTNFYSTFMYAHWTDSKVWTIFSRLNDIAKSTLESSTISKALTKLTLKKIERSMKKALMDIATSTNVEYEGVTVFSEKDKKEIRQSDIRNRGQMIKSLDRLKQNMNMNLGGTKERIDKMLNKFKGTKKQKVIDLMQDAYKVLTSPTSTRMEVMDAMMLFYTLIPDVFEQNTYTISMYTGTSSENSLPKEIVDILTTISPISVDPDSDVNKQQILDAINSLVYDTDRSQKYNATFGKNNQLFVYQNIEASKIFDDAFINDPLSYLTSKTSEKGKLTVYDLVKQSYKFPKDVETLLKKTTVTWITDGDTETAGGYDLGINNIEIAIDPDSYEMFVIKTMKETDENTISTRTSVNEDIKNTIYHEVNHMFRSVSSNERYSYSPDSLELNDAIRKYIDKNFGMTVETHYLLEKSRHPERSDSSIKDEIYRDLLYVMDDKEMNAFNMKQVVFIEPGKEPRIYNSNGFNFQDDYIITPTHTRIDLDLDTKLVYKLINAKLKSMSDKIFNTAIKDAEIEMVQMGNTFSRADFDIKEGDTVVVSAGKTLPIGTEIKVEKLYKYVKNKDSYGDAKTGDKTFVEYIQGVDNNGNKVKIAAKNVSTKLEGSNVYKDNRQSYMKKLLNNQKSAKVGNTYDIEFRNEIYRGVKDIIKESVPRIYRDTARIDDVIKEPTKYLAEDVQKQIIEQYGSLDRNSVMKYMQKYFYEHFKHTVDLTFRDGPTLEVVFVNIKNFSEYESDLLKTANYDGSNNSLTTMVKKYEMELPSGKKKKGIIPVSLLISKEHNFGLISRAVVRISDKEGPHYDRGVITLKSPKNNNDFRYQFAHEFQHLLDEANKLSGGTSTNFTVTSDMIKDLKQHVPNYIPKNASVKQQIKLVQDYVYHLSGERKAYGVTLLDADFVHIERKGSKHIAHMPWGGTWTLEADTQEGRASIIIHPERKSVPIGKARSHWLMKNYLKGRTTSIAQTESLTNFIFDLTEEDFKKLDVDLQEALLSYEMTSNQLLEYIRTTDDMNDFTFQKINKHFFENPYFSSLKEVDAFLKDLSIWHALYNTLVDIDKLSEYSTEVLTSNKIQELLDIIKKDKSLYQKYEKYREEYYRYNDIHDGSNSIRASTIFHMKGTLQDAYRMVAIQNITTRALHSKGKDADPNAVMIRKQIEGSASQNTMKTFSEVKEKTNEIADALASISREEKAQRIADVYGDPSLYEKWVDADIAKLNAEYINALKKLRGMTQNMKEFTEEDASYYNPTEENLVSAIELLGKRLWRATTRNPNMRKRLGYKFNSETKSIDFDFDSMRENGTFNIETLQDMMEELAYNLRIAEQNLVGRKGGQTKLNYEGVLNIYSKDVDMPDTVREMINKTANADLSYTNVQGTNSVEYARKSYRSFMDDNQDMLMRMIQTPGEVERVIEYISSDPRLVMNSAERERFRAYSIMVLAWIKNMYIENGLVLDNYHLELLDKFYNKIGHEWGTTGAALRTAVNLVSPTAYMLQELSSIDGVELNEQDIQPLVKAMRSGDTQRVGEEIARLERLIYERGGDNKMTVLEMFFSIRSSFMLSSPGTWIRNISSNIILKGSMRAASAIGTTLAEIIFRKTKGIEQKHGLWKIQGTKPTARVQSYSESIFNSDIYEMVRDGLNKYQYDEDKSSYKTNKKGEVKLDENGDPIVNMNNNMYAHMIVETIKKRFYGATSYEKSMEQYKGLKHAKFFGKMMDKANNLLKKVLSDERYIKARAKYYFDRMLTESIQQGVITEADLQNGVLSDKIATILGQAFTEACADYMHKGSFLKDFENILYKKYKTADTSSKKFTYGAAYSIWKVILPFANAGWNWFAEGVKYSPVGIVSGVFRLINLEKDINANPDNKMIAFRAKQELGKGVLGSVIMGIAIALAHAGLIGYDDEEGTVYIGNTKIDISALFGSPAFSIGLILGSSDEGYDWLRRIETIGGITLDGFFLTDFIDSLSYTSGGWQGWFTTSVENMLQSMIPNLWKTVANLASSKKYKTPYGFEGMWDRFMISLIGDAWGDKHASARVDPYTGELVSRWDYPIWSRLSYLTPIRIGMRQMSDVEKYSLEHGVPKSAGTAEWNDQESGEWSYDYTEYNRYRGELNNMRITEFMNDVTSYEVERNDKKVKLKASQMTDEEITKILKKIYTENSRYAKIWAWTQLGHKYYATTSMYTELKKLGISNVYLKTGKLSGFVK